MIRALKIWWIKRQARRHYLAWRSVNDDLDCGRHMAAVVRPLAQQHAENRALLFDVCMDRLRALGEPVPDTRLSIQGGREHE